MTDFDGGGYCSLAESRGSTTVIDLSAPEIRVVPFVDPSPCAYQVFPSSKIRRCSRDTSISTSLMFWFPVARRPMMVPSSEVESGYMGEQATSLSILMSPSLVGLSAHLTTRSGCASAGLSVENVNESF